MKFDKFFSFLSAWEFFNWNGDFLEIFRKIEIFDFWIFCENPLNTQESILIIFFPFKDFQRLLWFGLNKTLFFNGYYNREKFNSQLKCGFPLETSIKKFFYLRKTLKIVKKNCFWELFGILKSYYPITKF